MISGINLAVLLAAIVLSFFIMNFYFMSRYDALRPQQRKGWSWKYTLQVLAMSLLVILQPVLVPGMAWRTDAAAGLAIQSLGLALVAASLGLHVWARVHLGKYYVERVEVQPGHQLIDSGPYGLMRHPIITSFLGLAAGFFLLNPAVTTALVLIYTFWDFSHSAGREERLLLKTVPGYADYMDRVPRFLPRPRRR
jgi:protein-S-isoprenylcysteine O-methyltransferase Ste14